MATQIKNNDTFFEEAYNNWQQAVWMWILEKDKKLLCLYFKNLDFMKQLNYDEQEYKSDITEELYKRLWKYDNRKSSKNTWFEKQLYLAHLELVRNKIKDNKKFYNLFKELEKQIRAEIVKINNEV